MTLSRNILKRIFVLKVGLDVRVGSGRVVLIHMSGISHFVDSKNAPFQILPSISNLGGLVFALPLLITELANFAVYLI